MSRKLIKATKRLETITVSAFVSL